MNKAALSEKTNDELFAMYRSEQDENDRRLIRQELTMRYVYIVKADRKSVV